MVSGYKDLGLGKMDALKDKTAEPFEPDFKNVFSSNLEEKEKSMNGNHEMREMKELLLIHLDFIQQQSEQLTTKERQINELKKDNEMLKMRIERMERRMAIHKSRTASDSQNHPSRLSPSRRTPSRSSCSPPSASVENGGRFPPPPPHPPGSSPASGGGGSQCGKRKTSRRGSCGGGETTQGGGSGPTRGPKQARLNNCGGSSSQYGRTPTSIKRGMTASKSIAGSGGDGEQCQNHHGHHSVGQTMTEESYFTLVGERDSKWTADPPISKKQIQKLPPSLEVPTWRVKTCASSYTMEGTENLSDDVFTRRHTRFEIDEKRRKKWDVQRMREQRQVERLSRSQRGGGSLTGGLGSGSAGGLGGAIGGGNSKGSGGIGPSGLSSSLPLSSSCLLMNSSGSGGCLSVGGTSSNDHYDDHHPNHHSRVGGGGRGGRGGGSGRVIETDDSSSLQMPPDPSLLTLSVQPLVPVTAFGFPMPAVIERVDFFLPWLTEKDKNRGRSRSTSRKRRR